MDSKQQITLVQIFMRYLKTTNPLVIGLHLIYLAITTLIFSAAYVVSFHFTTLVSLYEEAHSIQSFGINLKTSVENDNAIYANLNRLQTDAGGMRTYVYRYHNGLAAISGVPFFFQTMTHEVIAPGAARIMSFEQRIPAGIHMAINNAFVADKCAVIRNTDRDKENQDYYFWASRGARNLVRCPIYMPNGDLFGFVGVDFAGDISKVANVEEQTKDTASEISKLFAKAAR